MQSLHSTGCLTKSFSLPSTPQIRSTFSGAPFLRCKIFNNEEKRLAKPVLPQRPLLTRRNVNLSAHSQEGSENYLAIEEPKFQPSEIHLNTFQQKLDAFGRFIWAEIVINKMWCIASMSLLAAKNLSDISPSFVAVMIQASLAVGLINIYISGFNQITDVEIDRVNKPHRPLVTGEYSMTTGVIISSASVIFCFLLGWLAGSGPLLWSLFVAFAVGTIYSIDLPYLRWKRIPLAAAFSMFILQAMWPPAIYLHMQTVVLGQPAVLSKAVIAITTFLSIFAIAQTLFKDIPDIEGDRLDGNLTFPVRFGAEKVFWTCIGIIESAYVAVLSAGLTNPNSWTKYLFLASHVLVMATVWIKAKALDLKNQKALGSFYEFMWKLVAVEFLLIHLLR